MIQQEKLLKIVWFSLKNKHNLLPLKREKLKNKKIAIIGEYAKDSKYQGKGSPEVTPTIVENAYDEISKLVGNSIKLYYSKGYNTSSEILADDNILIKDAKKVAKEADLAILFVGTSKFSDSEDIDNSDINLPENQVKLIKEISKVQKDVIVILSNGSPVSISSWSKYADTILEAWLGGQASGGAIADILFGIVNPCGKLSSTFPVNLSDIPTYLDYIDSENNLEYKEGIFVGYRYYDNKNIHAEFPFGFGLSYTNFDYSDLILSKDVVKDTDTFEVKLKIKNTGKYFGKEIVQLYIKNLVSTSPKAEKELKAFTKLSLYPGEEKEVSFTLNTSIFSHYDTVTHNWVIESGPYEILIGKSCRDIILSKGVYIQSSFVPKAIYAENTLIGDFLENPKAQATIEPIVENVAHDIMPNDDSEQLLLFIKNTPIRKLIAISNGAFTREMLDDLLKSVNK